MINLISDTVTLPSEGMRAAMLDAPLGDDVFGQDPSINALEQYIAEKCKMEAALFCPSGTMTNQIAIKMHTQPLDEMICNELSHVYQSETGGYAFHSGVAPRLIKRSDGKLTPELIESVLHPDYHWTPTPRLVVVENTCNIGGGTIYTQHEIADIKSCCDKHSLTLHMDGARLFNALVETGESLADQTQHLASVSLCLSKGLGAPVGSVLVGEQKDIDKARKYRKVFGGGMRQAGILAAAAHYALLHQVDRLAEDNQRAKTLGKALSTLPLFESVKPVATNIVIANLIPTVSSDVFISKLQEHGIIAAAFGPHTVRFVTHMHIDDNSLEQAITIIQKLSAELS